MGRRVAHGPITVVLSTTNVWADARGATAASKATADRRTNDILVRMCLNEGNAQKRVTVTGMETKTKIPDVSPLEPGNYYIYYEGPQLEPEVRPILSAHCRQPSEP